MLKSIKLYKNLQWLKKERVKFCKKRKNTESKVRGNNIKMKEWVESERKI